MDILVGAAAYSKHELLIRCDIGPKTAERSENEYRVLWLTINTYNIFLTVH
jgi:hypothetical protein